MLNYNAIILIRSTNYKHLQNKPSMYIKQLTRFLMSLINAEVPSSSPPSYRDRNINKGKDPFLSPMVKVTSHTRRIQFVPIACACDSFLFQKYLTAPSQLGWVYNDRGKWLLSAIYCLTFNVRLSY